MYHKSVLICFIVLAIAIAAPAALKITCTNNIGHVTISYTGADVANPVRAFMLDIGVSDGAVISNVTTSNADYHIYFSTTVIDENGNVTNTGSPVIPEDAPGEKDPGITIEMASLYSTNDPAHPNPPTTSGTLIEFDVDKNCAITVSVNDLRKGIVLENGSIYAANLPITNSTAIDCFPSSFTTYNDWVTMGKPDCWCNSARGGTGAGDYQCDGDVDGAYENAWFKYQIYVNDYNLVSTNWKKNIDDPTLNPCADIDHKRVNAYCNWRVYVNDYTILSTNWKRRTIPRGGDLPGNCGTLARPE